MDTAASSSTTELMSVDHEETGATPQHYEIPWITYAVIFICTALWAYLNFAENTSYYNQVVNLVAPRGFHLWTGAVWGLVTAAFVHFDFWHILFNMWWAKHFGSVLESDMGHKKYLLFILCAAMASSGVQLLFSGQTGIGFSGVVYAMFGFGVIARRVRPQYFEIIDTNTARWLLGWLVLCIVLTYTGILNVANGAHIGGFVFGLCIALIFVTRSYVRACSAVLVLLTAMTVLSVTYLPWSEQWQGRDEILEFIEIREKAEAGDPEAQFIYGDIFITYEKEEAKGMAWVMKSADQGYLPAMNAVAWALATDLDPAVRNADKAIELALEVCKKDGWKEAAYIDTLAAAYAEADRWEEALALQQQALEKLSNEDASFKPSLLEHLQKYQRHEKVRE